ncbi:MAG: tryptophan synthase subunit alpha [Clostridiales bacterium GWF2_36_10]|nr:MAG: tryptophan synthase subunit alpha [Clostridiales bacterium GWF2_36_10]HAN20389.1 tryptophan synthase subunit alpha [Clostridiales bacterium]
MSKINSAFNNKKSFIAFLTAGDPSKEKTIEYILEMEKAGADIIEIGIPFSDPTAEGPVIQAANIRALKNGMTTDGVFEIVEAVRKTSNVPLVFLSYLNPVFHYGYERFFKRCEELSVDGIIIPDLPYEEKKEILPITNKHGVDVISLIAPTSDNRIQMIAKEATGYIYLVSSMGVTGVRNSINTDLTSIVKTVRTVTDVPVAVGFGISTPEQAKQMADLSDGVIVGSAIVKIIEKHGDNANKILFDYVNEMKNAIK